jgi:hypothetical protein
MSSDVVRIGNLEIQNQLFAESINEPGNTFVMAAMDGIMGMGYSTISVTKAATPMENLFFQGLLKNPVFSFYLSKQAATGSELTFGGWDNSKFTGEISWHPVIHKGYWEISMESVLLGDIAIPLQGASAVVDTGTR